MAIWDIKERNNLARANQASRGDRGAFGGGNTPSTSDIIDFIQISTAGNAADFGNLSSADRKHLSAVASSTRGLYFGGGSNNNIENTIDYITIASTGNGTDFGDLSAVRQDVAGTSNGVRGIVAGGETPTRVNIIEFITIASTGDVTDFGDFTELKDDCTGFSDSHGGLQG